MTTYVEYTLEDGSKLLVETATGQGGAIKASNEGGITRIKAQEKFAEVLSSVKASVALFTQELLALEMDECEISFGLKTVGELGFFAVAKAGAEVNYNVTLRWKKKPA